VPDARWTSAFRAANPRPANEGQASAFETGNINLLQDTWIEVLDLASRRVIARQRFDEPIHGFLPDGRVYRVRKTGFDEPYTIEVRTLTLRGVR
jgi:hypothetical protein